MAFYIKPSSNIFILLVILFFSLSTESEAIEIGGGGITADLINGDSPLSPFYDPSLTQFQRVRNSLSHSLLRHRSIRSNDSKSSVMTSPPESYVTPTAGYYLMKIQVGAPPVEVYGIADTGSDLTWTQCAPCYDCFKQEPPIFDPKKSASYGAVPCKSERCTTLRFENPFCDNSTNNCRYEIYYGGGDGAHSYGDLGTDTFTFDRDMSFPKVAFGCGHDNSGEKSGTFSGIVGLGGGPVSIIRQLKTYYSIDAKISYCLPSRDSNAAGKINFGSNAVVSGPNLKSTPLVKRSYDTFHYVTLEGFSIGNEKLEYSNKAIVKEGNIFIDTGSKFTFLSNDFYAEFISALTKAVEGSPKADPRGDFKVCYEKPKNGKFNTPAITAHFGGGVDLVLSPEGTFVEVDEGVVCLTFLPSDSKDFLVFGNLQQLNYLIGIDLENNKVDFLPTTSDCKIPS
ncbi:hypothetical protein ABFS83_01G082800 [Erythranthe nasuta]